MLRRLYHDQPASFAFTPANLAWAKGHIRMSPDHWLKEDARCLPVGMPFLIGQKVGANPGGSGNAPRFPARQETTHPQDRSNKRNEGQRPTRRARSARRGRGGRWPGALAPGGHRVSVALWPGRWPRPDRRGRAHAEKSSAFR